MSYLRIAVQFTGVLDDSLAVIEVHINIKIRHGNAFRIKKTLKNQIEYERIDVRNCHAVCNKRTCAGTTSRTDRNSVFL